jgi:alkanesulfonate monooxygenase SsuD/methylene tetrahydromethanopterin reductase-like flavin-dependent oxidoreductase (luciferase family)
MRFGIFDHMDRSGEALSVQYENRLTLLEACDRAGFYCYHLAEHHQTPLGLASSPSVFLAAAAQRTKTLRLGALVFTLSVYHPLRILDEICMLDHLSKGRLDLGLGRGISPIEIGFYGVDGAQSLEIYAEVAAILQQGLTSRIINHQGKHFTFRDVPVELSPLQKPIPVWYGVVHPESAERAAKNSENIVCGSNSPALVRELGDRYRKVFREHHGASARLPLIGMLRHIVIADTDAEAREVADPAFLQWAGSLTYLWKKHNIPIPNQVVPPTFVAAEEMGICLVGSASTVREKLMAQANTAGVNYFLCRLAFGNLPIASSLRSVELMKREIMPAFATAEFA